MSVRYCCPKCKGRLNENSKNFVCNSCSINWGIKDGIPCFIEKDMCRGFSELEKNTPLNKIAEVQGWARAVEHYIETKHPEKYDYYCEYIKSEARADFHFLVPLSEKSNVLDIGSGWGNISISLARTVREVIALDSIPGNVKFVEIRARQEKIANLKTVCADALALPFEEGTFNLIIMNGVLRWVPSNREEKSSLDLQKKALSQVFRTLKRGGSLYLGIENRFGLKCFFGSRDSCTNLRFITVLPRFLANIYSRVVRGKAYKEYTYSYWQLKSILESVGFTDVQFYFAIPGYRSFRYLVDFQDRNVNKFFLEKLKAHPRFKRTYHLLGRIGLSLLPLNIIRWVYPSFSIVAVK